MEGSAAAIRARISAVVRVIPSSFSRCTGEPGVGAGDDRISDDDVGRAVICCRKIEFCQCEACNTAIETKGCFVVGELSWETNITSSIDYGSVKKHSWIQNSHTMWQ